MLMLDLKITHLFHFGRNKDFPLISLHFKPLFTVIKFNTNNEFFR